MRGRGRMDGQALGITHVGQMGKKLQRLDELLPGCGAALDAEDDHGSPLAVEILLVEFMVRIVGQPGITDPCDVRVFLQVLGDRQRVGAVFLHAQRQGFDALQEEPRVVRREAGTEIAQRDGAHAQDEGQWSERGRKVVAPAESVVAVVRIIIERVLSCPPREAAAVHHQTANAGAVAADPLGQRMNHDIGPEIERFGQIRRGEGGVDNERNAMVMGDLRHLFQIDDFK